MGEHGAVLTSEAVRARYAARRDERQAIVERLARRADAIARARLASVVMAIGLAAMALAGRLDNGWPIIPLVAFAGLVVWHRVVLAAGVRAERSVAFYGRGLDRLDERWPGKGTQGAQFADPHHPYAGDLDLFGAGSLYELLCVCRTRMGEDTLAAWMRADADETQIRRRQEAAAELGRHLDLREALWAVGETARSELAAETIRGWATGPAILGGRGQRGVATGLGILALVALGLWAAGAGRHVALLVGLLQAPVHLWFRERVKRIVHAVDAPARAMALVAAILDRVRAERFRAPMLDELAASLDEHTLPAIRRLGRLVDLLDAQRNPLFAPLGLALLWRMQMALSIEAWRCRHGGDVARWLDQLGTIEALVAVGTYAGEHPQDARPELVAAGPVFEATALGHPLLPGTRCVRNDLRLGGEVRVLIVSGSNMSGKSTLLRTVGVAIVLTRLGAPVPARTLRLSPLALGASIRTLDSLQEGTSRFYAEITRLRQVVDLAAGPRPVLFLLDEILHGTNSHDRRIGAAAVVRGLVEHGAIGLVTTHDLALAAIADDPAAGARNVHFADRLDGGVMVFDYQMRDGVVTHSNALALMRAVGLEV